MKIHFPLNAAMENTHIFIPEFINAETPQAFNNAAAEQRKEVSEKHISVWEV